MLTQHLWSKLAAAEAAKVEAEEDLEEGVKANASLNEAKSYLEVRAFTNTCHCT